MTHPRPRFWPAQQGCPHLIVNEKVGNAPRRHTRIRQCHCLHEGTGRISQATNEGLNSPCGVVPALPSWQADVGAAGGRRQDARQPPVCVPGDDLKPLEKRRSNPRAATHDEKQRGMNALHRAMRSRAAQNIASSCAETLCSRPAEKSTPYSKTTLRGMTGQLARLSEADVVQESWSETF